MIDEFNVQLSVSVPHSAAIELAKMAEELKTSKRAIIEEMIFYCTKNKVIKGHKKPRRQRASRIDHYAIVSAAWDGSAKRKDGEGKKLVTVDDVKKYLVTAGKSEATAAQYCSKRIPQNPLFAGLTDGWLTQDGTLYIITPRRYQTQQEILDNDPNVYWNLVNKIGDVSEMSDEDMDAAFVAAYYKESEK